MEITEENLALLKEKYESRKQELESLMADLNVRHKRNSLTEIPKNIPRVIELNKSKKLKISKRSRLEIYELVSGIIVDNISFNYHPSKNDKGEIEDSLIKFNVDAHINGMKFHVSYTTNQSIEDCSVDKIQPYDIKELEITMKKKVHQAELNETLRYFSKNPSKIGLALLCLKDYELLFNSRVSIRKVISDENPDFVSSEYTTDANENLHLQIHVGTDKRKYFTINWSIAWSENIMTVYDKFGVEIECQDEKFLESANHNFEKLIDIATSKVVFTNLNDEEIRKEADTSSDELKKQQLTLIRNAILAAKALE